MIIEKKFYTNKPLNVERGDILTTTNTDYNYDAYSATWEREIKGTVTCVVEQVGSDYTDYNKEEPTTFENCGYDFYEVVEVIDTYNVQEFEDWLEMMGDY